MKILFIVPVGGGGGAGGINGTSGAGGNGFITLEFLETGLWIPTFSKTEIG